MEFGIKAAVRHAGPEICPNCGYNSDNQTKCCRDMVRLVKALHIIAYEPTGESDASYQKVNDDIVEIAREALAAHKKLADGNK